jgi:hypothetical protein
MLTPTAGGPVEAREGARLRNRIGDEPPVVELHFPAGRQRNSRHREIGDRLRSRQRADRLVASADLGAPAGEVHVVAAKLAADIERGQSGALQPDRIESDPDLAFDVADAFDGADPPDSLQFPYDDVFDEEGELLGRFAGRDRGVGENGKSRDIDAPNHRFVDAAGEVGANTRDGILHVIKRAIGVGSQAKVIVVIDTPSVIADLTWWNPATLATASSTFLVTCISSAPGDAPNWVTKVR